VKILNYVSLFLEEYFGVLILFIKNQNRQTLSADDDEKKNLNNTKYRIQMVKVAHAIREIVSGIEQHGQKPKGVSKEVVNSKPEITKNLKPKIIIASAIVLACLCLVIFSFQNCLIHSNQLKNPLLFCHS